MYVSETSSWRQGLFFCFSLQSPDLPDGDGDQILSEDGDQILSEDDD
jgi:hypothetical protein